MEQTVEIKKTGIFEGVTGYHWLVVIIASCGWLFDCMDQRLFILAREATLTELLGDNIAAQAAIKTYIGYATTSMILGWATGGIIFGMMSDKWGRVKTMMVTLFIYSGFTGLSGFSQSWIDFTVYRFLVGLGVGGMFGAATTLVAESVPGNFRSIALGSLQALSATGNILGSLISLYIPPGQLEFLYGLSGWRVLFFVGIIPSLLIIPIITVLKEPEMWKKAKEEAKKSGTTKAIGSPLELFRHPRWRRNAIVGLCLGVSGMVGLWGIGFWSPELMTAALSDEPLVVENLKEPEALTLRLNSAEDPVSQYIKIQLPTETQALLASYSGSGEPSAEIKTALVAGFNSVIQGKPIYDEKLFAGIEIPTQVKVLIGQQIEDELTDANKIFLNRRLVELVYPTELSKIKERVDYVRSVGTAWQDVGAFFGMFAFTLVATFLGRRLAFLLAFICSLCVTMFVFNSLDSAQDAYWMLPMMGFAQLALFGGYSIYFPELFPTRLRGTGVGFCYNTVRYLAAPAPILLGYLNIWLMDMGNPTPFRTAAILMSFIYVIGMVALIWAPETKGQPLPEED